MEEALGQQITDYLIKPVNPNQILLTLKKIIDNKRLVSERTNSDYQREFRQISMEINRGLNYEEWVDIYKKIINWELKLDASNTDQMAEILQMQKNEANAEFSRYVEKRYLDWIDESSGDKPIMSHNLMRHKILPKVKDEQTTVMLLLDNPVSYTHLTLPTTPYV